MNEGMKDIVRSAIKTLAEDLSAEDREKAREACKHKSLEKQLEIVAGFAMKGWKPSERWLMDDDAPPRRRILSGKDAAAGEVEVEV